MYRYKMIYSVRWWNVVNIRMHGMSIIFKIWLNWNDLLKINWDQKIWLLEQKVWLKLENFYVTKRWEITFFEIRETKTNCIKECNF